MHVQLHSPHQHSTGHLNHWPRSTSELSWSLTIKQTMINTLAKARKNSTHTYNTVTLCYTKNSTFLLLASGPVQDPSHSNNMAQDENRRRQESTIQKWHLPPGSQPLKASIPLSQIRSFKFLSLEATSAWTQHRTRNREGEGENSKSTKFRGEREKEASSPCWQQRTKDFLQEHTGSFPLLPQKAITSKAERADRPRGLWKDMKRARASEWISIRITPTSSLGIQQRDEMNRLQCASPPPAGLPSREVTSHS